MDPLVEIALDVDLLVGVALDLLVAASFVMAPLSAATLDEARVVVVTVLLLDAVAEFRMFLAIGKVGRWCG